jgi:hypothetical protein
VSLRLCGLNSYNVIHINIILVAIDQPFTNQSYEAKILTFHYFVIDDCVAGPGTGPEFDHDK